MKRYLTRMLVAAGAATPLLTGCNGFRNLYDPCWPDRYSNTARQEVVGAFSPQVQNGHILDQTVWNYMFDTGTDELNGFGKQKLDYFVRQRPAPDPTIYMQTAHDVAYSPTEPERVGEARRELDLKRIQAIQRYLGAQTIGRPMSFEVSVHDPYPVGVHGQYATGEFRTVITGSSSSMGAGAAGSTTNTNTQTGQSQQGQAGGSSAGGSGAAGGSYGGGEAGSAGGSTPR